MERGRTGFAPGIGAPLALAAIALLLVAAALPGSASAAPTWLAPTSLSVPENDSKDPQLGVDRDGDTVAVWSAFDGTGNVVQAAERPAGGRWSSPLTISAPGAEAGEPRLAVDAAGDAVAVWQNDDGTDEVIEAVSRPAGGAWGAPIAISADGRDAESPAVAIDPAGDAVAVWRRYDGADEIVEASTRSAGGVWQTAIEVSEAGENAYRPQVAIDGSGDAVAVWDRSDGVHTIVQAASRPAGGSWGAVTNLSASGESAVEARVAIDPAGDAVAIWQRSNGSVDVVQAAGRSPAGIWQQPPEDLSESAKDSSYPEVAIDGAGDAVAVWEALEGGGHYVIQSADRTAGRTWQAPVDLSPPNGYAGEGRIAVDAAGDAVAAWEFYEGTHNIAVAAARPAGGAWGAGAHLTAPGSEANELQVAVDPDGDAVAAWSLSEGSLPVVQAAGYDATGPQLRSLAIPSSGTVGAPLAFSVSPFDVWSGPGTTSWSFGDGTTATGTGASHAFGGPGTYTVKVTSVDAVGNTSTATGTVTVPAPPVVATERERKGSARAGRIVKVKGRVAMVALTCGGGGGCAGTVRLTAAVKAKRGAAGSSRRRAKSKPKAIAIGKAAFTLPAGAHRTIKLPLTKKGRVLLAAAGRKGLKARLLGTDVAGRPVVLKAVGHRRRH